MPSVCTRFGILLCQGAGCGAESRAKAGLREISLLGPGRRWALVLHLILGPHPLCTLDVAPGEKA